MASAFDYEQISDYCWAWLSKKYNITYEKPKYVIKHVHRCWYRHRTKDISISGRSHWITYKKKHIGVYASMNCKVEESLYTSFIHEMTHYIQHAKNNFDTSKTVFSEIETTTNEIEFVKEHYPHLYNKLSKL
jgi:hypothetical protein